MAETILVITEIRNGEFRKLSYEVVSAARRIAGSMGASVVAVVIGADIAAEAEKLISYGPDKILLVQDTAFSAYSTETYTGLVADIAASQNASLLLMGASWLGKDLSARLSARLDAGLAMDCIGIDAQDGKLSFTRSIFGGKVHAKIVLDTRIRIATLRPNVFPAVPAGDKECVIEHTTVKAAVSRTRVTAIVLAEKDAVELSEAETVVAGGRGTGGDFSLIEQLAHVFINGAVAASRTAVDEGWRPHTEQVGQTGMTVSPKLYLACGISGAVQHMAGMSGSRFIVAINKDPEAPIFQKSDYGIVGDMNEVIPALIEELKKKKEA